MKIQFLMLLLLLVTICDAEQPLKIKYVTQQAWLAEVQRARIHEPLLDLEKYDPQLVREYALHFEPRVNKSGEQDLYWKLKVLAAFGEMADLSEVRKTVSDLKGLYPNKDDEWKSQMELYQLIIPARFGNKEALERLRNSSPSMAMSLLHLCRSQALREKFVEIATDPNEDTGVRSTAVYSLARSGDPRSLEIVLSDEFVAAMRAYGDIMKILAGITGIEEINDAPTLDAARKLIKDRGVRYPVATEIISVKGGIDWSKVKWETQDPLQIMRESIRRLPAFDVKQCPYCGERIKRTAPVCTFCGRELEK